MLRESEKDTMLYSHLHHHSASQRHNIKERRTQKDRRKKEDAGRLLYNIFTSHFIARVRKGCLRVACERMLKTEHELHILTPLLWPHVVSFLFSRAAQPGALGAHSAGCWLYHCILSASSLDPKLNRGFPSASSVGCGFPYHIWSLAVWNSTGNCSGTQTQLS